jgi:osmotically-inducible protein OsmY
MRTVLHAALTAAAAAYLFYWLRGMRGAGAVPDDVLLVKVRRTLEGLVRHSGSIDIQARRGEIVLSGPIGEAELATCLRAVRRIPGVRTITNRLRPHAMAA